MISKLRKLKGRSLAELADRGRQKVSAVVERTVPALQARLPADTEILEMFGTGKRMGAADLLTRFREADLHFSPAFSDPRATISTLEKRFPDERGEIVAAARDILAGQYDLLGYSRLDLGTPVPDWHLDPVSGKRPPLQHWSKFNETDANLTGDKKVTWELNRHQYFIRLGQAYWLTGDECYTEAFVSHIEDWIEKNPPKVGVNWVSSLEIAYRSISWVWAFHFFRSSPHFTPGVFLSMLRSLYLNGRHISRHLSTYTSPNTHLTGEALGLYVLGTFLKGVDEAEQWKDVGRRILIDALKYQVRPDGGYAEQATQYQRYTADIYLTFAIMCKAEGMPLAVDLESKLRRMLEFLMFVTQPNGETPLIGDDDGGRLHFLDSSSFADFRSTLAVGAAFFRDGKLKSAANGVRPELLWLLGPEGLRTYDSLECVSVPGAARAFADSGWYVVRDGWGPACDFLLIDCGEHGFMNGGHAHADALSFVASVRGVPVFVDSGTYTYTVDPVARDRFRSSSAHNCMTVNGFGSAVPSGPFSWERTPETTVIEWSGGSSEVTLRATHDGFERFGVRYEREFTIVPGREMSVLDKIETATVNTFEVNLVLSPEVEASIRDEANVLLQTKDGKVPLLAIVTKVIESESGEPGFWRIEPAQISPRYGLRVSTTKLIFSVTRGHALEVENRFVLAAAN